MVSFTPRPYSILAPLAAASRTLLTTEEVAAGRVELEKIAPGAGSDFNLVRLLALHRDGTYLLAIPFHRIPLPDETRPWNGCAVETEFLPLEVGVALVRSPANPIPEVERRSELLRKKQAEQDALRAAEQARVDRQSEEQAALKRRLEEFGHGEWQKLEPWMRLAHRLAIAAHEEGLPGLAARFRHIAYDADVDRAHGPRMDRKTPWRRQ